MKDRPPTSGLFLRNKLAKILRVVVLYVYSQEYDSKEIEHE